VLQFGSNVATNTPCFGIELQFNLYILQGLLLLLLLYLKSN